ncbi:MAG: hypothetical protein M5U34_42900 [Chloroflexi bacterium]|nr:hypothetical protein [Chloroflexota bacterium]
MAELQGGNVTELGVLAIVGVLVFGLVVWVLPLFDTLVQYKHIPPSGVAGFYNNKMLLLTMKSRHGRWRRMRACWCSRRGARRNRLRGVPRDGALDWAGWLVVVAENGRFPRWFRNPTPYKQLDGRTIC